MGEGMENQGMRVSLPILPISAGALFELVSARIPGLLYAEAGGVMTIWCGELAAHNLSWVFSYKALDERSVTSELLIFSAGRPAAVKLLVLLAWLFPSAQSSLQYLAESAGVGEYLDDDERPDSGHYKYSPAKRRDIAEEYRRARDSDEVWNKDGWAKMKYGISGKTLLSYEDEFPEKSEV
jgi:hypothetical protein